MISLWSKFRLNTQIVIVSAAILAMTIIILTIFNIHQQQTNLRGDLLKNGMALGKSLSSTLSYNVVSNEYDAIEELLLKLAKFPEVESLKLIDQNGIVLSHVKKSSDDEIHASYAETSDTFPLKLKHNQLPISFFKKNSLIIWYPLKTSTVIGWLNINIFLAEIKARRKSIIRDNVIGAIFALIIDVLFLVFIIRIPTRKINHAIELAQQLDTRYPKIVNETGGSYELNLLFSALNEAVKRLTTQNLAITRQTDELKDNNIKLTRAKGELQVTQDRFDRAINGTNDGLWDYNLQNSDVWCSSRLNTLLGYAESNTHIPIKKFISYFHSDDKKAIYSSFDFDNSADEMLDLRCRILTHNKNYSFFRIRGRLYRDADGEPVNIAGSIMDISEQVRIEIMKDEFISTVSHELRTPLTSIKGSLGLIIGTATGDIDPKVGELLEIANRNTELLLHIINDILDISKIESGQIEYHIDEIELLGFIRSNIELNQGLAYIHKVTLDLTTDINIAWVSSDEGRLNQILNNVISNAIKFSGEEGNVTVGLSQHHDDYRLSVTDDGPGIDKSYQPFLFDKFTQEASSQTRKIGGTGLGLAITKILIEQLGGKISYSTVSGEGSTFFIDIPILKKK